MIIESTKVKQCRNLWLASSMGQMGRESTLFLAGERNSKPLRRRPRMNWPYYHILCGYKAAGMHAPYRQRDSFPSFSNVNPSFMHPTGDMYVCTGGPEPLHNPVYNELPGAHENFLFSFFLSLTKSPKAKGSLSRAGDSRLHCSHGRYFFVSRFFFRKLKKKLPLFPSRPY